MEVVDATGKSRATGERFRVVAQQGETLYVHIFGKKDSAGVAGVGAYTLAINTLPQVAAVEAQNLLPGIGNQPGGPTTSLVLVFQGDRLAPAAAQVANNYSVVWFGPDGKQGTKDDRRIIVGDGLPAGAQAVVYDDSSNVDVASGLTYPTAIRQTVTLLFDKPLPAGGYEIDISPNVVSAGLSSDETDLLSSQNGFNGHTVVSVSGGTIIEGSQFVNRNLVKPDSTLGNLAAFENGTRFLTQFHNDLGALLDAQLTAVGDQSTISKGLLDQITARFSPALGAIDQRLISLAIIFLDPVSFGLVDPDGRTLSYDLQTSAVARHLLLTDVEVGGNLETIVIPNPSGTYQLNIADAAAHSRGGWVFLGNQAPEVHSLTDTIRQGAVSSDGISNFNLRFESTAIAQVAVFGVAAASTFSPGVVQVPSLTSTSATSTATSVTAEISSTGSSSAKSLAVNGGGDGSALRTIIDPTAEVWEQFSSLWGGLNRKLKKGLQPGNSESADAIPLMTPLLRVWRTLTNMFGRAPSSKESNAASSSPQTKNQPGVDQNEHEKAGANQSDGQAVNSSAQDYSAQHSHTVFFSDPQKHIVDQDPALGANGEHEANPAQPTGEPVAPTADASATSANPLLIQIQRVRTKTMQPRPKANGHDYWVASSRCILSRYLAAGLSPDRVFLSYHGGSSSAVGHERTNFLRSRLGIGAQEFVVGNINFMYPPKRFLGQSVGLKCHEDVIDALSILTRERSDVVGVFVGEPPRGGEWYGTKLRARALRGAGDRVRFAGYLSPDEIASAWADFDVAVHVPYLKTVGVSSNPYWLAYRQLQALLAACRNSSSME